MNIVALEPLGIPESEVLRLAGGLTEEGHSFTSYPDRNEDTGELINRAAAADIVLLTNQPFRREVIAHCPNLKLIAVAFTGVDHVDMEYCHERGITVCNAAGYSTHAVAELVFGLAISVLRRIVPCDRATRSGGTSNGLIGFELYGKTFGIVGTGAIGLAAGKIAKAFGCRVLAYSRSRKSEAIDSGIEYTDLDSLLAQSDIVSLHLPLLENTRNLIHKERLELMKPSAILINTARGPIVDNEALAAALNNGQIAGAGIDVFETEPPLAEDHPLMSARNTVLTPHVAFATHEALRVRAEIVFANIAQWLKGDPQNVVSRKKEGTSC
ncbi:Glycerate dehydrogenase [compost metagenome]